MKHFEDLKYLDMEHLEFATKYLKRALSHNRPLDKALSIGTVVECNTASGAKLGTVVGYGSGREHILFEDPEATNGHRVMGSDYMTIKKSRCSPIQGSVSNGSY